MQEKIKFQRLKQTIKQENRNKNRDFINPKFGALKKITKLTKKKRTEWNYENK